MIQTRTFLWWSVQFLKLLFLRIKYFQYKKQLCFLRMEALVKKKTKNNKPHLSWWHQVYGISKLNLFFCFPECTLFLQFGELEIIVTIFQILLVRSPASDKDSKIKLNTNDRKLWCAVHEASYYNFAVIQTISSKFLAPLYYFFSYFMLLTVKLKITSLYAQNPI